MARQLLSQPRRGLLLGVWQHMQAGQFDYIAAIAIAQLQQGRPTHLQNLRRRHRSHRQGAGQQKGQGQGDRAPL
jgi:hypothetical protein